MKVKVMIEYPKYPSEEEEKMMEKIHVFLKKTGYEITGGVGGDTYPHTRWYTYGEKVSFFIKPSTKIIEVLGKKFKLIEDTTK